jgi:hypothetical protein
MRHLIDGFEQQNAGAELAISRCRRLIGPMTIIEVRIAALHSLNQQFPERLFHLVDLLRTE